MLPWEIGLAVEQMSFHSDYIAERRCGMSIRGFSKERGLPREASCPSTHTFTKVDRPICMLGLPWQAVNLPTWVNFLIVSRPFAVFELGFDHWGTILGKILGNIFIVRGTDKLTFIGHFFLHNFTQASQQKHFFFT